MTLELVRNPDVLADLVAARRTGQIIVGFAAETEPDRDAGSRSVAPRSPGSRQTCSW